MTNLPKLMEVNRLFFNFYNAAYPDCRFSLDEQKHLLTVTLSHSIRVYRVEKDMSIKY